MKKLIVIVLIIVLAVYFTWDNRDKQIQKDRNIQQIEKNIKPYLND